jgi:hypothetical protein
MNKTGYPVEWRGQALYLSDRTDKVKQRFCKWAALRTLDNARETMPGVRYYSFERAMMAHLPQWTTLPDPEVAAAFAEPDAGLQLLRLHLDATPDELPDEELKAFLAAKEADPDSDYMRALRLIEAQENPKAPGACSGSQAPTDGNEPSPNSAGSGTST